jgi:drug/metabolite transporter (DMT)-like permease
MTSTEMSEAANVDNEAVNEIPLARPAESRRLVMIAYAACALIWGTTWYAIRVCIETGGFSAYTAAALRFTIAAALLALYCFFANHKFKRPTPKEFLWISAAGLLSGLAYGFLYTAETSVTGGIAAVISATAPLMAASLATVSRTERPTRLTMTGCLVSVVGVFLVFHDRLQVSQSEAAAVGILLVSSFLYASSNVVMKHHGGRVSPVSTNSVFFVAVAVLLWAGALATGSCSVPCPLPAGPTIALLYLSLFGTLLTFVAYFYLLKHVRLSTATTLGFVTPVIALIVDALFERHGKLAFETYLGIAVVLAGVALNIFGGKSWSPDRQDRPGHSDCKSGNSPSRSS